jgi:hypothetical protein
VKPLAIDLYCGLGGWTEGLLAEGWEVIGFDIERRPYSAQLVLQDVLTLHGFQLRNASLIVASPPCQAYSYRAMPWKSAKAQVPYILPEWWAKAEKDMSHFELSEWNSWKQQHPIAPPDNSLFYACFRIQEEASAAAGRHIPLIVENVKGAQPWVGRAKWHFGSYYLWGDIPALMPLTSSHWTNPAENGIKQGGEWWHDPESITRKTWGTSTARKIASAQIAKIPFPLARHIAAVFKPREEAEATG